MNEQELLLKVDKARWWVLQNQPFYGSLIMGLRDKLSDAVPTARTNGVHILWNPKFLDNLEPEQLRFVLVHEVMHCANGHLWRFPADHVDHMRMNIACDNAINHTLDGLEGVEMPKGGQKEPKYRGLAEEEIYHQLPPTPQIEVYVDPCGGYLAPPEEQEGSGRGRNSRRQSLQGPNDPGGIPDPSSGKKTPPRAGKASSQRGSLEDAWKERLIQAVQAQQALGCGNVPADVERTLEEMRSVHLDWKRELSDFVREVVSTRNDWTRSSRRFATAPVIYPRKKANDLGRVVFVRDTSGSMSNEQAAEFTSLITQCLAETGCSGLVLDCDTKIQNEYWLNPGETCPLTASGMGGTDFRPPFRKMQKVRERGEKVAGMVYLTDLDGPEPAEKDVDLPLLWISTDKSATAKTGRTVYYE